MTFARPATFTPGTFSLLFQLYIDAYLELGPAKNHDSLLKRKTNKGPIEKKKKNPGVPWLAQSVEHVPRWG